MENIAAGQGKAVLIPRPSLKAMMRRQEEILRMWSEVQGVWNGSVSSTKDMPNAIARTSLLKSGYLIRGKVYTWTADYGAGGLETPIITQTNLEGGGRLFCIITDTTAKEMSVGLPVEFVLRKSYGQTIPEYIWKARPAR